MDKRVRKITLSRETLRRLTQPEIPENFLRKAAGAATPNSDFNTCTCPTFSCKPGFC